MHARFLFVDINTGLYGLRTRLLHRQVDRLRRDSLRPVCAGKILSQEHRGLPGLQGTLSPKCVSKERRRDRLVVVVVVVVVYAKSDSLVTPYAKLTPERC